MIEKSLLIYPEMITSIDTKNNTITLKLDGYVGEGGMKDDAKEFLKELQTQRQDYFNPINIVGLELNYKIDK